MLHAACFFCARMHFVTLGAGLSKRQCIDCGMEREGWGGGGGGEGGTKSSAGDQEGTSYAWSTVM